MQLLLRVEMRIREPTLRHPDHPALHTHLAINISCRPRPPLAQSADLVSLALCVLSTELLQTYILLSKEVVHPRCILPVLRRNYEAPE